MKKTMLIFAILLFLVSFNVSSESTETDSSIWFGSNYMPGNIALSLQAAFEQSAAGSALLLYPAGEFIIYKPIIGNVSPVDFGAAVIGRFGLAFADTDLGLTAGAGAFATAHMGFKGLEFPFAEYLARLDYYIKIGPVFDFITPSFDTSDLKLGLGVFTGLNYFLTDNFAISVGYSYWRGYGGGTVGVMLKIGPGQDVTPLDLSYTLEFPVSMVHLPYVSQFQALYWYSFAVGGFMFDDSSYKTGEGTVWAITSSDAEKGEEFLVERALLKILNDGSKWWKVIFTTEEEELAVYEFLVDPEYKLLKLRYRDSDTMEIGEYVTDPAKGDEWSLGNVSIITEAEYSEWVKSQKNITVRAGQFDTDYIVHEYKDDDYSWMYEWWVASDVPGVMVKFHWEADRDEIAGELIEITEGNITELGSY